MIRKAICRKEKKCKVCHKLIKLGEIQYRYGSSRFAMFMCEDCKKKKGLEDENDYQVIGKCNQCGQCCRLTTYSGEYEPGSLKGFEDWLMLFNITPEIYNKKYAHSELPNDTILFYPNVKCKYLDNQNQCKIFGQKQRPSQCKMFPHTQKDFEHIKKNLPGCDYLRQEKEKPEPIENYF